MSVSVTVGVMSVSMSVIMCVLMGTSLSFLKERPESPLLRVLLRDRDGAMVTQALSSLVGRTDVRNGIARHGSDTEDTKGIRRRRQVRVGETDGDFLLGEVVRAMRMMHVRVKVEKLGQLAPSVKVEQLREVGANGTGNEEGPAELVHGLLVFVGDLLLVPHLVQQLLREPSERRRRGSLGGVLLDDRLLEEGVGGRRRRKNPFEGHVTLRDVVLLAERRLLSSGDLQIFAKKVHPALPSVIRSVPVLYVVPIARGGIKQGLHVRVNRESIFREKRRHVLVMSTRVVARGSAQHGGP